MQKNSRYELELNKTKEINVQHKNNLESIRDKHEMVVDTLNSEIDALKQSIGNSIKMESSLKEMQMNYEFLSDENRQLISDMQVLNKNYDQLESESKKVMHQLTQMNNLVNSLNANILKKDERLQLLTCENDKIHKKMAENVNKNRLLMNSLDNQSEVNKALTQGDQRKLFEEKDRQIQQKNKVINELEVTLEQNNEYI